MESKEGSPAFELSSLDLVAVGKGALIAAAGAGLTYLIAWGETANFGDYTPIVVAGLSVLSNLARKYLFPQKA